MNSVKYRNMGVQILLLFFTFGLYAIYWFYQTGHELKFVMKDAEAAPTLWTVLMFVPLGALYSYFCYVELYSKFSTEKIDKWILYILCFAFLPIIWFLVQRDLNKYALKQSTFTVA